MLREFHLADLFTIANGFCGMLAIFEAMTFLSTRTAWHLYLAAFPHTGRPVDLGPTVDLATKHQTAQTIDATGRVVMPGFVDPHMRPAR